MSAHDTPEVGSGETVGERTPFDGGRLPHDRTAHELVGSFWFAAGCPRCQRDAPAYPNPVQPADAGEGLADWLGNMDESRNVFDITDEATTVITIDVESLAERICARHERILAAREAAWAEKYAAVVGERPCGICDDHARVEALIQRSSLGSAEATAVRESVPADIGIAIATAARHMARAEAAEAALATALREKAEDRARVEAVEALADEKERRIAEINAEPDPLTGRHSTMAAFALTTEIRAALAIPTSTGDE